jgi:hypothetical protein
MIMFFNVLATICLVIYIGSLFKPISAWVAIVAFAWLLSRYLKGAE